MPLWLKQKIPKGSAVVLLASLSEREFILLGFFHGVAGPATQCVEQFGPSFCGATAFQRPGLVGLSQKSRNGLCLRPIGKTWHPRICPMRGRIGNPAREPVHFKSGADPSKTRRAFWLGSSIPMAVGALAFAPGPSASAQLLALAKQRVVGIMAEGRWRNGNRQSQVARFPKEPCLGGLAFIE